ncbi:uncharacterized protein LOC110603064 [Manihot esculenta]|uniref:Senescence regulator S40 n=3 Tax=Manihot esculenta TaxID=3983 RepID=A0A2C9U7P8_MANES|nr:uncharacterized protein LOC110603064 [Manihot esculenta]XP_021596414.1 uncharacterized protein LOC110603064 [Manihot esculenta]XP_021596416.1 uncharacterized protein LOC110603064 [Manihot esculenta]XP_021596418.1 uncharacterized protein LOC110603064 [Manihot esculenta]XP_021596420.1 uncharacterized protein LOC110603064 [Manihot esculenta]XP_021596422.1 uncharacterized protein LOC110603064 [Manihot esculenta]XP_043808066.1 uncharacterized protein LOC110603064 [Manihot esculenta]KAG8635202.
MADWHGIMGKGSAGGYSRRSISSEDFEEEDIWSVVKEREDSSPNMRKSKEYYSSASSSSAWRLHSAPRMIPRANLANPPTAAAAVTPHETKLVKQSSAPVNIPDWSKIYQKNTRMGSPNDDNIVYDNGYHNDDVNDNDDDEGDEMVPPHEWLAKKFARSQISSFSVCEGIGRTLKGRDLSKVRNAILTKTGFLE